MVKRLTRRTLTPAFVGSIPTTPAHLSMFLHLLVQIQLAQLDRVLVTLYRSIHAIFWHGAQQTH